MATRPLADPHPAGAGDTFAAALALIVVSWSVYAWLAAERSVDGGRLRFAEVRRGELTRDVLANGRVVAANSPNLYAPAAGTVKLETRAGATVKRDGSESEAYLELPPADLETHVSTLMTEHIGEMDYQLKKQANNFWAFLAGVQEVRKGVQEGRHQSAE